MIPEILPGKASGSSAAHSIWNRVKAIGQIVFRPLAAVVHPSSHSCVERSAHRLNWLRVMPVSRSFGISLLLMTCLASGTASAVQPMIASGRTHAVALRSDGTVWAWGTNNYGQLGDGTLTLRNSPVQVSGLTGVVSVSCGVSFSLALKSDGTVWAWGQNNAGQLGDGTLVNRKSPVQVSGLTGVVSIAGGYSHSLVVKSDGTVWAWGENTFSQLGDGATANRKTPWQVSGLTGMTAVAGGLHYSLAVKSDGTVRSWGRNNYGQLGDGSTTGRTTPVTVSGLSGVVAIASCDSHALVLKSNGTVWSWGRNSNGQLGDGSTTNRLSPVQVSGLTSVASIACGVSHSLVVKSDGTGWSWGANSGSQLGSGDQTNRTTPGQVNGLTGLVALVGGIGTSHALSTDGVVWMWGYDYNGKIGLPGRLQRAKPLQVVSLTNVVTVAGGTYYSLAVKSDGTAWSWGDNSSWQLGDGTSDVKMAPVQVAGLTNVSSVATREYHSLALKSDGTVWSWGPNFRGQLGDGTNIHRPSPLIVSGLSGVTSVACGSFHSVVLKSDGTVWSWGENSSGELGDGSNISRLTPVSATGLTGVVAVAAGRNFSMALKSNGTVWSWGSGLGNSPTQISGLTGVTSIACGFDHALALKSDGTVWAWGDNTYYQLGDDSIPSQTTPVLVGGLSGVVKLAAGLHHCLASKSDGTLWAWGGNSVGQLGDGTPWTRATPVKISDLKDGSLTPFCGGQGSYALKSDGNLLAWGYAAYGELANALGAYILEPTPLLGFNLTSPTPVVSIFSPANDTPAPLDENTTVEVSASVSTGTIEKVYFYADGIYIGEDDTAPFTYTYTPATWGDLEINAIAASSSGAFSLPSYVLLRTFYDSDSDGMPDRWEKLHGFDPNNSSDALADADADDLSNLQEYTLGTNPKNRHSDNDGVPDGIEVLVNFTDPLSSSDGDSDGIPDDFEKDLAKQLIKLKPDPGMWESSYYAGLTTGNLDPDYDYTGDGMSTQQLFDTIVGMPLNEVVDYYIEPQWRSNRLFGIHVPAFSGSPAYTDGSYENIGINGWGYNLVTLENSANFTTAYLSDRINSVDWMPHAANSTGYLSLAELFGAAYSYAGFSAVVTDVGPPSVTEYTGVMDHRRFRILSSRLDHDGISLPMLKVDSRINYGDEGVFNFVSATAEHIELPKGRIITDWIETKAPIEHGKNTKQEFIPLQIVDAYKYPISKLKVGKMSDAGVLTGSGSSTVLDIDKDPDRFFIRVPGGAAFGGISVKVSTSDNPVSDYNDDATQIDLQTDGNDAISNSMLLVADDVDDDHPVDGIADDAAGDRTHKIQLGGNFKIVEIKIGSGAWQTVGGKTPVPVEKTTSLSVVILRQTVGGSPVISQTAVENDLKIAQERYAQVGIKLAWTINTDDPPNGVVLADGLTEFTGNTPTAEEKALFDGLGTPATNDIHVFYVNFFSPAPGSTGEAFPPSYFSSSADASYTNNLVISATLKGFSTLPHEIGHILLNDASHEPDSKNLMYGTVDNVNRLLAKKRFRPDQETKMHSNTNLVK